MLSVTVLYMIKQNYIQWKENSFLCSWVGLLDSVLLYYTDHSYLSARAEKIFETFFSHRNIFYQIFYSQPKNVWERCSFHKILRSSLDFNNYLTGKIYWYLKLEISCRLPTQRVSLNCGIQFLWSQTEATKNY